MAWLPTRTGGVWVAAMHDRQFAAIVDWFNVWFFGCGVAILLLVDLKVWLNDAWSFGPLLHVASGGLMLAAAAVMAGWLLGLLFGIPRALSRPQPAAGPAPGSGTPAATATAGPRTSRTNTNLEDVSDWLTKTLVGLGLVNLTAMPGYVWRKAGQIGPHIFPQEAGPESIVLLIAGYFAMGGFWLGYVGTRTMITLLFDFVDLGSDEKAVILSADPRNLRIDAVTQQIAPATDGLLEADRQVLSKPLWAWNTPGEFAAWAAATARTGDLKSAVTVLQEATKKAPDNAVVQQLLKTMGDAKP